MVQIQHRGGSQQLRGGGGGGAGGGEHHNGRRPGHHLLRQCARQARQAHCPRRPRGEHGGARTNQLAETGIVVTIFSFLHIKRVKPTARVGLEGTWEVRNC